MSVEQNKNFAANLLFQITLFIYLLILIFFGMTICGLCLRQQDICFILALGRFIVENGRLPDTDPFSWTYAIYPNGCPFVVHQWLTDVIFYLLVKNFAAISLVLVTAMSLALAFLALPLQAMKRLQLSRIQTLLLASISGLAACSHVQARPEIFFYLFVSIYYVILVKADQDKRLSNGALVLLVLVMILWANLHSGFVAGLLILCFWLILSFVDQVILGKGKLYANYIFMPLCLAATLINPAGYKLWLYLPACFLCPINHYISELRHFDLDFFHYIIVYPFFFLILAFFFLSYKIIKKDGLNQPIFKPFFIGLIGMLPGLCASRFMNLSSLTLIMSIALLLNKTRRESNLDKKTVSPVFLNPQSLAFGLLSVILVVSSALFFTVVVMPAEIPEGDAGFTVPIAAMEFLKQHPQSGKLLNESQYGDILMWHMRPCPKIFIDSRFDLYSPIMAEKYFKLVDCKPGWQDSLKSFNIDWIFFPPQLPFAKAMRNQPDWVTIYSDQAAVILRKKI